MQTHFRWMDGEVVTRSELRTDFLCSLNSQTHFSRPHHKIRAQEHEKSKEELRFNCSYVEISIITHTYAEL